MSAAADALLATPLVQLPFPTRLMRFIERRGLTTVRDLLLFTPASLTLEPNLGRKSVSDAREILKAHLGVTWEVAREAFVLPPAPSSAALRPPTPAENWASLRSRLPKELLDRALDDVPDLPARIRTFAGRRKLTTTSELVAIDYDELANARGVGRGTLRTTLDVLGRSCRAPFQTASPAPPAPIKLREVEDPIPAGSTWRSLLHGALRALGATDRLILTQRAGLAGPIPTLAELGECLGLSRERIRQLESRGLDRVRRAAWHAPAKERLERAAPSPLIVLQLWRHDDALFAFSDDEVDAFTFFVNEVLDGDHRVLRIEESHVLTTLPRDDIEETLRSARILAPRLRYPLPLGEHLEGLARALDRPADEIVRIAPLLEDEWIVEGELVTGFGTTKRGAILAYVRAAQRPVAKTEIEERFGRVNLADDYVFVDHGLVTVAENIPDWERWRRRIPPAVRSLLERHGPERQWTTHELVPLLAEEADLPAWLNDWTLGSLLRDAPEVRYLGRNVVALPEVGEERLHVHALVVETLESANGPLDEEDLLRALTQKRGLGPNTWSLIRMRRPFVFFEDGRVGLLPRDVPGGAEAIHRFADAVFASLDARQAGLQQAELRSLLTTLDEPIASWDTRLARSVLRHDGRFRCAAGGAVGLAEWEDLRAPSQREILEELMIEHDGIVPVEEAMHALPTASGEPLSRGRIGLLANSIRARLVGAYIEWMPEASGAPERSPAIERVFAALPEDIVGVFRELLEPVATVAELRDAVSTWHRAMRAAAATNPNVELDQVERLATAGGTILARFEATTDPDEAKLCCAALRYLAAMDDATTDTAIGGLDDDETVLDVVTGMLSNQSKS